MKHLATLRLMRATAIGDYAAALDHAIAVLSAPEVDPDDTCGGCGSSDCECSLCRRGRALRGVR